MLSKVKKEELEVRNDSAGSGEWMAPRGDRLHLGIDYVADPGDVIASPVSGEVSKYGYVYKGDYKFRYVEVTETHSRRHRHRLFYTDLLAEVAVGSSVRVGEPVATVQDIREKYPEEDGMLAHVHYEVLDTSGEHISPAPATAFPPHPSEAR